MTILTVRMEDTDTGDVREISVTAEGGNLNESIRWPRPRKNETHATRPPAHLCIVTAKLYGNVKHVILKGKD